jgi:hypothetical protein
LQLFSEVQTIDSLHGEPQEIVVLSCLVDHSDSRDSELAQRLEFPHESLSGLGLIEVLHLDGYRAPAASFLARILGSGREDYSRSPSTEFTTEDERPETGSGLEIQCRVHGQILQAEAKANRRDC